jgi:hypothetical protein
LDLVDVHEQIESRVTAKAIPESACGVLAIVAAVADEYVYGHHEPPGRGFLRSRALRPGKLTQLVTHIQVMNYLPDTEQFLTKESDRRRLIPDLRS